VGQKSLRYFEFFERALILEYIQNNHKISEWPYNIPNGLKIFHIATKYANIFHLKDHQKYFKISIFGLKISKPSGNSGVSWYALYLLQEKFSHYETQLSKCKYAWLESH
jgi:hypothetical protein